LRPGNSRRSFQKRFAQASDHCESRGDFFEKVIAAGLPSGDDLARHPVAALSWKMQVARNDSRKRPNLGVFGVPASCEAPLIGSWLQAVWITLRVIGCRETRARVARNCRWIRAIRPLAPTLGSRIWPFDVKSWVSSFT
jgi:hypothetical protein